jgi:hypothetical protein
LHSELLLQRDLQRDSTQVGVPGEADVETARQARTILDRVIEGAANQRREPR